jgi:hypothetical protein
MLPAELRLLAYSNLIPEDFKGETEELKGILLSCKLLHEELLHELTKAFRATLERTLASVTSEWNAEFKVPLRITQSGSKLDELSLKVEIPVSVPRDLETPNFYDYDGNGHD